MKKLILLIGIIMMISLVSGQESIHVVDYPSKWNILGQTGNEANFDITFLNKDDKKTEICFTLKDGVMPLDVNLAPKSLYDRDGNLILDDKGKSFTIKYETAKCDGKDGYHLSLTTAQMVNIDDYIKLGDNSAYMVYQNESKVVFDSGFYNVSATLYKNISNNYNNTVDSVFVGFDSEKYKFGANDTLNTGYEHYMYKIESVAELKTYGGYYYFSQGTNNYKLDFSDICNKVYTEQNLSAECAVELSSRTDETNQTYDILRLYFYSNWSIDPTIGSFSFTYGYYNNTVAEGTSFIHQMINDSDLIVYYPFNENTSTVYDYSQTNTDATIDLGLAEWNETGKYGGAMSFHASSNRLSANNNQVYDRNLSICVWARPSYIYSSGWIFDQWSSSTGIAMFRTSTNRLVLEVGSYSDRLEVSSVFVGSDYHHICGTVDNSSSTLTLYKNGLQIGSGVRTLTPRYDSEFKVSSNNDGGVVAWQGELDEFMIFTRVLTETEISNIYNNTYEKFYPSGSYRLLEQQVDTGYNSINVTTDISLDSGSTQRLGLRYNNYTKEGLVAAYFFDSNNSIDVINGNNGTVTNLQWNESGNRGGQYQYRQFSNGGKIDVTIPQSNSTNLTMAWWSDIYTLDAGATNYREPIDWIDNMYILFSEAGAILIRYNDASWTNQNFKSIAPAGTGEVGLHHYAITYNTNGLTFNASSYKNGAYVSSYIGTTGYSPSIIRTFFNDLSSSAYPWNGTMDDILIYNRTLSNSEVQAIYNAGWKYTQEQSLSNGLNVNNFTVPNSTTFMQPVYTTTANTTSPTSWTSNSSSFVEWNFVGGGGGAPTDDCTYLGSGNWIIDDGSICYVSSDTNIGSNILRVDNGHFRVISGARFTSGGCFIKDGSGAYAEDGSGMFCE